MNLSDISKKIIFRIGFIALAAVSCAFLLAIFISPVSAVDALLFSAGALLMSALNCVKLILLERAINKISGMDNPQSGKVYALAQYVFRYFLTIIAAAAVIFVTYLITGESPFISLSSGMSQTYAPIVFGMITGLLSMKIAIYAAGRSAQGESLRNAPEAAEPRPDATAGTASEDSGQDAL